MKFRDYLEEKHGIDIFKMIKNANFKYTQTKCIPSIFRLYKEGKNPFIDPSFIGNYDETINYLKGLNK